MDSEQTLPPAGPEAPIVPGPTPPAPQPAVPGYSGVPGAQPVKLPSAVSKVIVGGVIAGVVVFLLFIALIVGVLLAGAKHSQHLKQVGRQTQATVLSAKNVQTSPGHTTGHSYSPPTYSTQITYKLNGVSGYPANRTSSASLATSGSDALAATVGSQIGVTYDPSNPADNAPTSNLQTAGTVLTYIFVIIFAAVPLIIIVTIALLFRRAGKRKRAIQDMQA